MQNLDIELRSKESINDLNELWTALKEEKEADSLEFERMIKANLNLKHKRGLYVPEN